MKCKTNNLDLNYKKLWDGLKATIKSDLEVAKDNDQDLEGFLSIMYGVMLYRERKEKNNERGK